MSTQSNAPALEIKGLHAWYGESHILHGVDLTVNRGRGDECEGERCEKEAAEHTVRGGQGFSAAPQAHGDR